MLRAGVYSSVKFELNPSDCTNPWCTVAPWTAGDTPDIHFSLDSPDGITLHNDPSFVYGMVSLSWSDNCIKLDLTAT